MSWSKDELEMIADAVGRMITVYEKIISSKWGADPAYYRMDIRVAKMDSSFETELAEMTLKDLS